MALSTAAGFTVVDLETTGFRPTTDRVIEIAVVHVDADGTPRDDFSTLVRPQRDVGASWVHGITASDLTGAPTFPDVAPVLAQQLRGRVFVAHNAPFDWRFIEAEFQRCGHSLPAVPTMCTMQLAAQYLHPLPARSLSSCCGAAGITQEGEHDALSDARAAAALLSLYRRSHSQLPASWVAKLEEAMVIDWGPELEVGELRCITRAVAAQQREQERGRIPRLIQRLPRTSGNDVEHYLATLDRILEDRVVTEDEARQLEAVAREFAVGPDAAERAHRQYLEHLCALAREDALVTDEERADILSVADLLGIDQDEALAMLAAGGTSDTNVSFANRLARGDRVVFTGEMDRPREALMHLARDAGLVPMTSVSRRTALLVAADPHSESGKARSARALGVRIVTEQVFLHLTRSLAE